MGLFSNISIRSKFNKKLENVSLRRNKILMEEINSVHPLFSVAPVYVGNFYQGVTDDSNCRDFLEILANSSDEQIDLLNRILVLWLFWSADRLMNIKILGEESINAGFKKIWSLTDEEIELFFSGLDNAGLGGNVLYVWREIEEVLKRGNLSPISVLPHLRNAIVSVL